MLKNDLFSEGYGMNLKDIKTDDFLYESKYINVLGSKIHYIEQGQGDPILFLHGIPTSSYLWRNVIPWVSEQGRCIALDMIGLGKSAKPDIAYGVSDHIQYVEAFIKAMGLKNITLVMHGWGSVIGFDYAMRHESNVKSLVFLESHVRHEPDLQKVSLPLQHLITDLHQLDEHSTNTNFYIDSLLHRGVMHKLSQRAIDEYHLPFKEPHHHKPLYQYLKEMPVGHYGSKEVIELINNYSNKLTQSHLPKLMLYAIPGFNTTVDTILWAKDNVKNLTLVDIGEELHYVQETNPHLIGQHLSEWVNKLSTKH